MKRLIGLLMVILMLSCMSGCSSNRNENNEDYPPVDKTLVVINDMEFHLDKETSFREMYNRTYGEIQTQAGKDRRKRAADQAMKDYRKDRKSVV